MTVATRRRVGGKSCSWCGTRKFRSGRAIVCPHCDSPCDKTVDNCVECAVAKERIENEAPSCAVCGGETGSIEGMTSHTRTAHPGVAAWRADRG